MGGNQSTVHKVNDEVRNEFLNRSEATCKAVCQQTQSGNIIVVDGSVGDIEISQKCEAKSSCVIKQSLDVAVETILQTLINSSQDYQDSLFSLSWNSQRTATENSLLLSNKITNIMSASCNSEVSQMQSDNIIYVRGSADSIALTQQGSSKSNCTMDNMAKMVTYNDIAKDIESGQGRTSAFGAMMAAIGTLIIFGVIMFIMMIMFTGVVGATQSNGKLSDGKSGSTKSSTTNPVIVPVGGPRTTAAATAANIAIQTR